MYQYIADSGANLWWAKGKLIGHFFRSTNQPLKILTPITCFLCAEKPITWIFSFHKVWLYSEIIFLSAKLPYCYYFKAFNNQTIPITQNHSAIGIKYLTIAASAEHWQNVVLFFFHFYCKRRRNWRNLIYHEQSGTPNSTLEEMHQANSCLYQFLHILNSVTAVKYSKRSSQTFKK
jgi:hypothetical protein